ncbi:MAG: dUTP diphosphatase [Candidatus Woesearchaeota archaeon]
MNLKFMKTDKDVPNPEYIRDGDVAFDLRSNEEDYILKPMEKKVFKTGLKIELPIGHVGNIRDRSGLAAKHSIHSMAGIIDPNYRGEIGIVLINLGNEDFKVEKNMRIAQMLIQKCEIVEFTEIMEMSETNRGEGNFGSSGYK